MHQPAPPPGWAGAVAAGLLGLAWPAVRTRSAVAARRRWWAARSGEPGLRWVALGDSLTLGVGSSRPQTSWVGRTAAALAVAGHPVVVDNRAVYGARVADVLAGQRPGDLAGAHLVTLCVGANDAGRTTPEQYRARLHQLCALLPAGAVVGDVPEFQFGPRIAAAAELSRVAREVVAEHPRLVAAPVEARTTGTSICTELAGDFFHPNDGGYARIAGAFTPALLMLTPPG